MPTILFCNNKQVTYLHRQHINFQHYTLLRGGYNDNNNYYLELYPTFCYLCISQFYNSVRQTFKKSLHDNGQWTRKNASV